MLIIMDERTKKVLNNLGTNSLYPDGNLPIKENENEIYIRLHDDSVFAKKIMLAYEHDLVLNDANEVTNVVVDKTLEEFQAEQNILPPDPTESELLQEYVVEVDFRVAMIELGF